MGFLFIHATTKTKTNQKHMNKNNNDPGNPGYKKKADPVNALSKVLSKLAAIYEEAGVPPSAARTAALADFECDFGVLPLAA